VVGVLGLGAAMSTSVLERMRELGVMQAVGATRSMVLRVILGEGLFVGATSGLIAIALAVPLSTGVGALVGGLAFRAPLPLVMSLPAALTWLAVALLSSAVATAVPALSASRMTVREALAYV
jgi:putative ABC transport system permease protein